MKIPIDLSPSPPLIDLSEANYEEIDSLIEKCPRIILDKLQQHHKQRSPQDQRLNLDQQGGTNDENTDIPEVAEIPRDRLERTIAEAIKETSDQIIQEIKAEIRAVDENATSPLAAAMSTTVKEVPRGISPSLDDFDPLCADNLSGPPSPERQRNFAQALADVLSQEQSDAAYNDVKRCLQGVLRIERESVQLVEMFGCGNFGQVHKAILRHEGREIPCATKSLRAEFSQASMCALSQEADLLASLDHPHVVRLFGVSEIETGLMMVMELAPLGPLNRFLRYNKYVYTDGQ
ncbi:tyrosine-protein kinase SYK-like [Tropilaelaps mercedesae]|uniref:Tyrosine-protein kinase SYK-like n=1 Tax=Tropilaelaps mercedesae TaxID=418985 RepID=A0A1V9XLE4_9ACAR|nr:tyrosine-protein kinase SYK-like [Tropilaelaps mercedesae]